MTLYWTVLSLINFRPLPPRLKEYFIIRTSLHLIQRRRHNNTQRKERIVNGKFNITELELITQDPQVEAEILASIENIYCSDEEFDSGLYELKNPISVQDRKLKIDILDCFFPFFQILVSKKVSDLILQNQSGYAVELQRVTELQANLQEALLVCGSSRRYLNQAKKNFTVAGLGILSKYRKRQHLSGLLQALHTIKTLQQTDVRLRELMDEENYPGAIQLCLACQKAAANFRHYKCISELSSKLQDTLVMIEEQLDVALSAVCGSFNSDHYSKLQTAYRLLGKTQTSMDQLHMHFTSAIHNKAFTIILKYVKITSSTNDLNLQKRQYTDLCTLMYPENFTACLLELCKTLWDIMHSYYCIINWHEKDDLESTESADKESNVEMSLSRQYTKQKLEHGLLRIWQDIQHKVKLYLQAIDLSSFKFDEFICVLDVISRLMHIGEEFCNSKSEALQESVRKQSINYFRNYHRARIDELKIFLENEGWKPCPVKSNFSILKLTEFKFITNHGFQAPSMSSSFSEESKVTEGYFVKYIKEGNPFDIENKKEDDDEDFYEDNKFNYDVDELGSESDDSDIADELKKDYVDEKTGELPTRRYPNLKSNIRKQYFQPVKSMSPILSNTTLNVLRLVGK
ncbi:Syndetin [Nymphon striatum]|nr:Syndetin [Nymphon striatum]